MMSLYTREEVSSHDKRDDCWIIVHGKVYDVTNWLSKHPGGGDIIFNYAGQDATVPFEVLHPKPMHNNEYVKKHCIGQLVEDERELPEISQDFLNLKKTLVKKGLFDPSPYFLFLMTGTGILIEGAGIALLWFFPASWTAWITAVVCLFISGAHMQEVGHDLGHYSCFKNLKYNYWAQNITFTFLGGQSSSYWNKRHNEHHSKPSVISKDPDVTFPGNAILLGNDMPKDVGRKGKGMLPYQYQHIYLTVAFPIFLLTIGFNIKASIYLYKNLALKWTEALWLLSFFIRWYLIFVPVCGSVWGAVALYFAAKILQGLWLSILTQSHHLHLGISAQDKHQDWFSYQVEHCFNFTPSWFINWATAYTNYHIEHHLFPTMPVENHHLAAPYIKELCKKHGLKYREISWAEAIAKVPRELQRPGEIWLEEYKNISKK